MGIRGHGNEVIGEVFARYQVSRGDYDDVPDKILKFPNVSGRFVCKKKIERIFGKGLTGGPKPERLPDQKMVKEQRYILQPFVQSGNTQRKMFNR